MKCDSLGYRYVVCIIVIFIPCDIIFQFSFFRRLVRRVIHYLGSFFFLLLIRRRSVYNGVYRCGGVCIRFSLIPSLAL